MPLARCIAGWNAAASCNADHELQQEAEEERSLDEILERLHRHGRESLSPEDRHAARTHQRPLSQPAQSLG